METKGEFILLYAGYWSTIDEKTGLRNEGISANYLVRTNLDAETDSSTGAVGYRVTKGAIPLECKDKIKQAPAIYDGTFFLKTTGDGKAVLTIKDLEFKSLITVSPVTDGAAVSDKSKKGA